MTDFNSGLSLSDARGKGRKTDDHRAISLDIEIYGVAIILTEGRLYRTIKQVAESSGCKKRPGAVPVWNVERRTGMGARRDRSRGVVGA